MLLLLILSLLDDYRLMSVPPFQVYLIDVVQKQGCSTTTTTTTTKIHTQKNKKRQKMRSIIIETETE